jgi:hypothetical protein
MKRVVVAVEQEDARINHGLPYFAELDAHNSGTLSLRLKTSIPTLSRVEQEDVPRVDSLGQRQGRHCL